MHSDWRRNKNISGGLEQFRAVTIQTVLIPERYTSGNQHPDDFYVREEDMLSEINSTK